MDVFEEYQDKFKKAGIRTPTKEELESYRKRSVDKQPADAKRDFGKREQEQELGRLGFANGTGLQQGGLQPGQESERKKLAARMRENMRVRKSFSFDPMATSLVFAGLKIYVEIEDQDAEYAEEVRKLCTKLGGTIVPRFLFGKKSDQSLKPDVIIWHHAQYKTLERAQQQNIAVVNHNWVFDCISKQKKLPYSQFELTNYQKEEAKTRDELGIGSRRRNIFPTKRLSRASAQSLSEQKGVEPRQPAPRISSSSKQTHLSFQQRPGVASAHPSTTSNQLDFKPVDTSQAADTKPSRSLQMGDPGNLALAAPAGLWHNKLKQPKRGSTSILDAVHSQLRDFCLADEELREVILENEEWRKELQMESKDMLEPEDAVEMKLPPKTVKMSGRVQEEGAKAVQTTLNWDRVKARVSGQANEGSEEPGAPIPVTKFLRAFNPLGASASKPTGSNLEGRKGLLSGDGSETSSQPAALQESKKPTQLRHLTLFYCGQYATVAPLKELRLSRWAGLSIIKSSNFHHYGLPTSETWCYWDPVSSKGDLGVLWALLSKVRIVGKQTIQKWADRKEISLEESEQGQFVKIVNKSESTIAPDKDSRKKDSKTSGTSASDKHEVLLHEGVLAHTYIGVFKAEHQIRRSEYVKLRETVEGVAKLFQAKVTHDSRLMDILVVADDDLSSHTSLKLLEPIVTRGAVKVVKVEWLVDSIFAGYKLSTSDPKYAVTSTKRQPLPSGM